MKINEVYKKNGFIVVKYSVEETKKFLWFKKTEEVNKTAIMEIKEAESAVEKFNEALKGNHVGSLREEMLAISKFKNDEVKEVKKTPHYDY